MIDRSRLDEKTNRRKSDADCLVRQPSGNSRSESAMRLLNPQRAISTLERIALDKNLVD